MMETVTDKAGRKIQLRRMGVVEELRLYKALGPGLSFNDVYMSLAKTVASAAMIDEVPVPFPTSEASFEALAERLGEDGVAAIEAAVRRAELADVVADAGN